MSRSLRPSNTISGTGLTVTLSESVSFLQPYIELVPSQIAAADVVRGDLNVRTVRVALIGASFDASWSRLPNATDHLLRYCLTLMPWVGVPNGWAEVAPEVTYERNASLLLHVPPTIAFSVLAPDMLIDTEDEVVVNISASCLKSRIQPRTATLRILPLEQRYPVPEGLEETGRALSYLSAIAALAVGAAPMALQSSRYDAIFAVAACRSTRSSQPSFWAYPLQVELGDQSNVGRSLGAAVLNTVLLIGAALVHGVVALIAAVSIADTHVFGPQTLATRLVRWMRRLHFPTAFHIWFLFFAQSTTAAACQVMRRHDTDGIKVLAVFAFLVWVAVWIRHGVALGLHFGGEWKPDDLHLARFILVRWDEMWHTAGSWRDRKDSNGFCASQGVLFRCFRKNWHNFITVELFMSGACGMTVGLRPEWSCSTPSVVLLFAFGVYFGLLLATRPFSTPWNNVTSLLVSAVQCVGALFSSFASDEGASKAALAAAIFALLSAVVMMGRTVVDIYLLVRKRYFAHDQGSLQLPPGIAPPVNPIAPIPPPTAHILPTPDALWRDEEDRIGAADFECSPIVAEEDAQAERDVEDEKYILDSRGGSNVPDEGRRRESASPPRPVFPPVPMRSSDGYVVEMIDFSPKRPPPTLFKAEFQKDPEPPAPPPLPVRQSGSMSRSPSPAPSSVPKDDESVADPDL